MHRTPRLLFSCSLIAVIGLFLSARSFEALHGASHSIQGWLDDGFFGISRPPSVTIAIWRYRKLILALVLNMRWRLASCGFVLDATCV